MAAKVVEPCAIRLKKALAIRNMKQAELAEMTGIPKSAISHYISGSFEPKQDRIYLMAQALNVSEAWLMGLDVPMERQVEKASPSEPSLTEREKMILEVFRLIPEEQQQAFLEMGRLYANSLKKD